MAFSLFFECSDWFIVLFVTVVIRHSIENPPKSWNHLEQHDKRHHGKVAFMVTLEQTENSENRQQPLFIRWIPSAIQLARLYPTFRALISALLFQRWLQRANLQTAKYSYMFAYHTTNEARALEQLMHLRASYKRLTHLKFKFKFT